MTRPSDIENFTPLFESVVQDLGVIGAAVYGRVWRYCQGEHGACQASTDTIGDELGIHRRTVMRYLDQLCDKGYIIDHTPELRNRPHTYTVTESHSDTESQQGVTQSHSAVTESRTGCDRKSLEERKKREKKRERTTPDGDIPKDDLWPTDSNFAPRDEVPEETSIVEQRDYLSMAAEVYRRTGGRKSWTVTGPEGANPWADAPVRAFCTLAQMAQPPPNSIEAWAREFEKLAQPWGLGPPDVAKAISMIAKDEKHNWRSFTSPFNPTFREVMDIMLGRIKNGYAPDQIRITND